MALVFPGKGYRKEVILQGGQLKRRFFCISSVMPEDKRGCTGLSDEERVNFVRPKRNRYLKNAEKKRHKKSKRSNIKYFLTIYFLTETTQKCTNFVDTLLVLHFLIMFSSSFRFRQSSQWTTEIRNMSKT